MGSVSALWGQRSGLAAGADLWDLGFGFAPCPTLLWASGPVVFLASLVWERVPSTWSSPQHSVFSSV